MRGAAHDRGMESRAAADLSVEAERYLAAVAAFRAEGCEPEWRIEPGAGPRRRRVAVSNLRDPLASISRRTE
jgi:hypothetical protein